MVPSEAAGWGAPSRQRSKSGLDGSLVFAPPEAPQPDGARRRKSDSQGLLAPAAVEVLAPNPDGATGKLLIRSDSMLRAADLRNKFNEEGRLDSWKKEKVIKRENTKKALSRVETWTKALEERFQEESAEGKPQEERWSGSHPVSTNPSLRSSAVA